MTSALGYLLVEILSIAGILLFGGSIYVRKRNERIHRRVSTISLRRTMEGGEPARTLTVATHSPLWRLAQRLLFGLDPLRYWSGPPPFLAMVAAGLLASLATFGVAAGTGLAFPFSAGLALAAGLLAVRWVVGVWRRRNENALVDLFPEAIDMLVRMLRSGLPITSAITAVSQESRAPVSTVLDAVSGQISIGIPLDEALTEAADRIRLPDFRFFSVAVSLQRATGGNLAATLEAMSELLRKRKAMRMKARATSAEVRTSAIILAALPFAIAVGLFVVSPEYVLLLLKDPRGQVLLAAAGLSLVLGGATMHLILRHALEV